MYLFLYLFIYLFIFNISTSNPNHYLSRWKFKSGAGKTFQIQTKGLFSTDVSTGCVTWDLGESEVPVYLDDGL